MGVPTWMEVYGFSSGGQLGRTSKAGIWLCGNHLCLTLTRSTSVCLVSFAGTYPIHNEEGELIAVRRGGPVGDVTIASVWYGNFAMGNGSVSLEERNH